MGPGFRPFEAAGCGEVVAHAANGDARRTCGALEEVVPLFQVLPETVPARHVVLGEVRLRHAERKYVHGNVRLAGVERVRRQLVDLEADGVGHGEAADRRAAAVNEDVRARPQVHLIEGVGVTDVERLRPTCARVEALLHGDRVEAFGRLLVALLQLRSQRSRPVADRVRGKERIGAVLVAGPDLHLRLRLEDADEDRRVAVDASFSEAIVQAFQIGCPGKGQLAIGVRTLALGANGGDFLDVQ